MVSPTCYENESSDDDSVLLCSAEKTSTAIRTPTSLNSVSHSLPDDSTDNSAVHATTETDTAMPGPSDSTPTVPILAPESAATFRDTKPFFFAGGWSCTFPLWWIVYFSLWWIVYFFYCGSYTFLLGGSCIFSTLLNRLPFSILVDRLSFSIVVDRTCIGTFLSIKKLLWYLPAFFECQPVVETLHELCPKC